MPFSRDEIQDAFDRYCAAAEEAGRTGDWRPWVECFTPDLRYIEHLYGEFQGRDAVQAWIEQTMNAWPFTHMQIFPWDWYTIDAEQGWVVGQVENRFIDPGDGERARSGQLDAPRLRGRRPVRLRGGRLQPADFAPVVEAWLAAWAEHHPEQAGGAPRPAS